MSLSLQSRSQGDGGDCEDGAKVSFITRCIRPDMHHDNLTLVYDNYYENF